MTVVELIERKRDGGRLADAEIDWLIRAFTAGLVTDYQMAAMTMAVFLNGLDEGELAAWTSSMLHSGDVLDLRGIDGPKVDKHSTGGVGDKVSIPLVPIVAACGVIVPMISGRGLGHTGGTLDKLESIPGFRTEFDPEEFTAIVSKTGLILAGQSETLAPADRKLYALRDVTETVPSLPLISSSIMSKKLAEGLDGLVLDVKVGRGAFSRSEEIARELAETMIGIGKAHGVEVVAILTAMDQPLGREVGNASEIRESLDVLAGGGPPDLVELVYRLGADMLLVAGVAEDDAEAKAALSSAIHSGRALDKFAQVIAAQGGDPNVISNADLLARAPNEEVVTAARSGYVTGCDARAIGVAAMHLGAGRTTKESKIDPGAGISLVAKEGDKVIKGEQLARFRYSDGADVEDAKRLLNKAWSISGLPASENPLVIGEVRW